MVELKAGDYRLVLDPARGGSIARFDWHGPDGGIRELMRPSSGSSIFDVACFPLVPFSNRIAHGRFRSGGHEVSLASNFPGVEGAHPLHGFGWLTAWSLVEAGSDRAVIEHYHEAGEWPWAYRARQDFNVSADGLSLELSVTNLAADPMPAGLGFHPYFPRDEHTVYHGMHAGEWITAPNGLPVELRHAGGHIDWWHGAPVGSRVVDTVYEGRAGELTVIWPAQGHRLVIEPSANLDRTVVYTPADEGYFCVEPVTHSTDAVNRGRDGDGLILLAPGDTVRVSMHLHAALIAPDRAPVDAGE